MTDFESVEIDDESSGLGLGHAIAAGGYVDKVDDDFLLSLDCLELSTASEEPTLVLSFLLLRLVAVVSSLLLLRSGGGLSDGKSLKK